MRFGELTIAVCMPMLSVVVVVVVVVPVAVVLVVAVGTSNSDVRGCCAPQLKRCTCPERSLRYTQTLSFPRQAAFE